MKESIMRLKEYPVLFFLKKSMSQKFHKNMKDFRLALIVNKSI